MIHSSCHHSYMSLGSLQHPCVEERSHVVRVSLRWLSARACGAACVILHQLDKTGPALLIPAFYSWIVGDLWGMKTQSTGIILGALYDYYRDPCLHCLQTCPPCGVAMPAALVTDCQYPVAHAPLGGIKRAHQKTWTLPFQACGTLKHAQTAWQPKGK